MLFCCCVYLSYFRSFIPYFSELTVWVFWHFEAIIYNLALVMVRSIHSCSFFSIKRSYLLEVRKNIRNNFKDLFSPYTKYLLDSRIQLQQHLPLYDNEIIFSKAITSSTYLYLTVIRHSKIFFFQFYSNRTATLKFRLQQTDQNSWS